MISYLTFYYKYGRHFNGGPHMSQLMLNSGDLFLLYLGGLYLASCLCQILGN